MNQKVLKSKGCLLLSDEIAMINNNLRKIQIRLTVMTHLDIYEIIMSVKQE